MDGNRQRFTCFNSTLVQLKDKFKLDLYRIE